MPKQTKFEIEFARPVQLTSWSDCTWCLDAKYSQQEAFDKFLARDKEFLGGKTISDVKVDYVKFCFFTMEGESQSEPCWNINGHTEKTRGAKKVWVIER